MPASVQKVFKALSDEVVWLHARWILYRELFAESRERMALLNACAPLFFFVVHETFEAELHLGVSRLTDPTTKGKFSLLSLRDAIAAHGDKDVASELTKMLSALDAASVAIRDRRNKLHAHLSREVLLSGKPGMVKPTSRAILANALELVREYMNAVESYHTEGETETAYDVFLTRDGAEALVALLKNGLRYEQLVNDDKIAPDDWMRSEWRDA